MSEKKERPRTLQDFMSPESAQAALSQLQAEADKKRPFIGEPTSKEDQARVAQVEAMPKTWRSYLPVFRQAEYWQRRADTFKYIERSDAMDDFFLRGITVHPRLSEYPQCKDVIRDYFACREESQGLAIFNVCAPMKEQMSACINEVFVKKTKQANQKARGKRENARSDMQSKKVERMHQMEEKLDERKHTLQD